MNTKTIGLLLSLVCVFVYPGINYAQDDFEEVETSPIEKLAYEEGTGEIRGYGQSTSASEQLALNIAKAQAMADLQQKIEQYVRYGLNQYLDEKSVDDQSSIDEESRNDIVVAAKGVVKGVTVLKTRKLYSKSQRKYKYEVCVKYDKAGILNVIEAQNKRILKNKAQFEKEMQEAWDVLDKTNGRKTAAEKKEEREERINAVRQENLDRENKRAIDRVNAIGKNAVELEKARSKNAADDEAREEARKDREALRKAATQKNTPSKRIVIEHD